MQLWLKDIANELGGLLALVLLVLIADIVRENLFAFFYCSFWTFVALVAIPWLDKKLYPENYGLCRE